MPPPSSPAQARSWRRLDPDLDAAALKAALVQTAARAGAGERGAPGLVDVPAAAATEVVVDPPSLAARRPARLGESGEPRRHRPQRLATAPRDRDRPGQRRLGRPPGDPSGQAGARPGRVGFRRRVRARADAAVGTRRAVRRPSGRADGSRRRSACAGRSRCPSQGKPLLTQLRLSQTTFVPSDANPAVLSVVAGRVDGTATAPAAAAARGAPHRPLPRRPAARDDRPRPRPAARALRVRADRSRPARQAAARPGEYSVRLVATPVDRRRRRRGRCASTSDADQLARRRILGARDRRRSRTMSATESVSHLRENPLELAQGATPPCRRGLSRSTPT